MFHQLTQPKFICDTIRSELEGNLYECVDDATAITRSQRLDKRAVINLNLSSIEVFHNGVVNKLI